MPRKRSLAKKAKADESSMHERNVLWIVNNFGSGDVPSEATERQAPSDEAWSLLQVYDADAKSRKEFMDRFYRPLYAKDKEQSDDQAKLDDQRKFFRLFELLEAERPELLNDNFPTEPAIRPESILVEPEPNPVAGTAGTCVVASAGDAGIRQPEPKSQPEREVAVVASDKQVGPSDDPFALAELYNQSQVQVRS
jgi:hypothetical protein